MESEGGRHLQCCVLRFLPGQQVALPVHQGCETLILVGGDGFNLAARGNEGGFEGKLFGNGIAAGRPLLHAEIKVAVCLVVSSPSSAPSRR